MKVIFTALIVGCLGLFSAFGQEKELKIADPFAGGSDQSAPKNISVQLELIELSHKDLTGLLMEHKPKSFDATSLRMKVQEMVDKNVAKIIETQMVISKPGLKTSSNSTQETIYPADYQFSDNKEKGDNESESSDSMPVNSGNPDVFETRNVGISFDVEASIGEDAEFIDVRFLSKRVWQSENTILREGKDILGNPFKITVPNFYVIEIDTSMAVVSGQYCLAGLVTPKDAKGLLDSERKVMAFLKCDVLSVIP